jgi:hypothetical protein
MTASPISPRLVKGGLVLVDPTTGSVLRIISLQYNPDSISRTLQVQGMSEGADRSEALRLKGPPVETIKVEAEIDAADQLEFPDQNSSVAQTGIFPQLAALELLIYPTSQNLLSNYNLSQAGTLEIAPMEMPLTLFVWSAQRILPVRITDFSITEEAFDPALNPIRAKVSLGMRVLSVTDLGFEHTGGSLYMVYHQQKEQLASTSPGGALGRLGISGIPA